MSAEDPNGNEFDHWLRTNIMEDSINVRGDGYHVHIKEIYTETFAPHNGFLKQYYGFDAQDVFDTILKLDSLVYSKVGSPFGATQSHKRLTEWMDEIGQENVTKVMMETGKHFIMQFTEANPDLYDVSMPEQVIAHSLDNVEGYNKICWVIPKSEKETKIFDRLSLSYGDNNVFLIPPKFKAFPLNDTLIKLKPLIKENSKYYHFSLNLAFRNIFKITEELIKEADAVYYEHTFRGNTHKNSRDNYIEQKTKQLIQKILPTGKVYHSLKYNIVENGQAKRPELDLLAITEDYIYIIEVKAGQLNQRHRRGEMLSLKDRLKDTINEGSYQCQRALKYIHDNEQPVFDYVENGTGKVLTIDKNKVKAYFKISVTFEHFASISANLKYLIDSGVLSLDLKWTWIVSLYDLMIFADLINGEEQFVEYLKNRIDLYDRNDIIFQDEIDILGFYFENKFPLGAEKENETVQIVNFKDEIETYYTQTGVGMPGILKLRRKTINDY